MSFQAVSAASEQTWSPRISVYRRLCPAFSWTRALDIAGRPIYYGGCPGLRSVAIVTDSAGLRRVLVESETAEGMWISGSWEDLVPADHSPGTTVDGQEWGTLERERLGTDYTFAPSPPPRRRRRLAP